METTCIGCGDSFLKRGQYEFFCSNPCRAKYADYNGLNYADLMREMDDLALIIYHDYLMEVNMR